MQGIAILVPTRGRPAQVREFLDAFHLAADDRSVAIFAVDEDDPTADEVEDIVRSYMGGMIARGPRRTMVEWTNRLATVVVPSLAYPPIDVLASLGDDHRLEPGFEGHVARAFAGLGGTGIVYGDDTHQGEGLATSAFVSRDIVELLGWMIPPVLDHLYCDNAWMALGRAAGCLRYVPELRIPHHHPAHEGKTFDEWDATYREGTGEAVWEHDGKAFDDWHDKGGLALAASKVIGLRARTGRGLELA